MSSNIKITRICKFCENEFTARTTKTLYCILNASPEHTRQEQASQKLSKVIKRQKLPEIQIWK